MAAKNRKQHGQYCRVCRERKANEKFSGKGHSAHICKTCAALTPAERAEKEVLNKIDGMAYRHLSEPEIKWLRKKMHDKRNSISEAARVAHNDKFPRYERNMTKKGLTALSLEFFIHGEVCDEWGDTSSVYIRFFVEDTGVFRRINYRAPEPERESVTDIGKVAARRLLKSIIHELDALFWDEDLGDEESDIDNEREKPALVPKPYAKPRKTYWSLHLELNNGEDKDITFYHRMHDAPQKLFRLLMERFESAD